MKTHYEVLEVAPDASAEQIKQAFRQLIARYHPDKVHHLGNEFQALAQVRAAELTTAYTTLSNETRRAEYDETLRARGATIASRATQADAAAPPARAAAAVAENDGQRRDARVEGIRTGRDSVLRRAALKRVEHLFHEAFAVSELWPVAGFDLSYLSKPRLFDRRQVRPWLLAKFVPCIDKRTVQQVRAEVARANAFKKAAVSVFLLSGRISSEAEVVEAIATQHPEHPVVIVPVDVRDWRALVPQSADATVRTLASSLKTAS